VVAGLRGGGDEGAEGLPNGLELSCPAARATLPPLNGNLAGNTSSNFPPASRVSCSELLGSSLVDPPGADCTNEKSLRAQGASGALGS